MPLTGIRSLYGATKLSAEFILKEYSAQYGLPSIIDRCGVIAGPWQLGKADQGVFTFWLANHYFKKPLKYIGFGGEGKQVRDLLHIDDLGDLLLEQARRLMGDKPVYRGEIFNAGGSVHANLSLRETTSICAELTGHRMDIGTVLEDRPADVKWFMIDNGDTGDIFGWKPKRSARKILEDTFEWLKKNETDFRKIFV